MSGWFVELSTKARISGETVSNVLHYWNETDAGGPVTSAKLADFAASWLVAFGTNYAAPFPTAFELFEVHSRGFETNGFPSTVVPDVQTTSHFGANATDNWDGVGHCAILRPVLDQLITVSGSPGLIRRSYWAIGPLANAYIDGEGKSIGLSTTAWTNFRNVFKTDVTSAAGDTYHPIKASFTDGHVPVLQLTGFRRVSNALFQQRTRFRRSRNNQR